jgi:hypothetical protein
MSAHPDLLPALELHYSVREHMIALSTANRKDITYPKEEMLAIDCRDVNQA